MHRLLPLVALFFILTVTAHAQAGGARGNNFWKCTLPSGTYEVVLRSITAISTQQYVVEGGIQITELSIDTLGNTEARFYYMQSIVQAQASSNGGIAQTLAERAQDKIQTATDRVSSVAGGGAVNDALNTTVVKNYPTTTHAHTVEYRVASASQIDDLFKSIQSAWESNVTSTYPPPAPASS